MCFIFFSFFISSFSKTGEKKSDIIFWIFIFQRKITNLVISQLFFCSLPFFFPPLPPHVDPIKLLFPFMVIKKQQPNKKSFIPTKKSRVGKVSTPNKKKKNKKKKK